MKKQSLIVILVIICIIVGAIYYAKPRVKAEEFSEIYSEISNIDFSSGKLRDGALLLYDENGNTIMSLEGDPYEKADFIAVYKNSETSQIMFIMGGSVDDTYGVLYVGKYGIDMNGINRVERIGGNAFYFQT